MTTSRQRGQRRTLPAKLDVHYVKSTSCRVIHVSGAWGSITPQGIIHAAVYSEHVFLPEHVEYPITEDGKVTDVRFPGNVITREIEAELFMNQEVATSLRNWLNDRLAELEILIEQPRKEQTDKETTP